jgi:hypothetical protein
MAQFFNVLARISRSLFCSFVYGYAKNERDNIEEHELRALKLLAAQLLGLNQAALTVAMQKNELKEVRRIG